MKKFISFFEKTIIHGTFFLFPLFFLPFSQEFFQTQKLYLLIGASLLLVLVAIAKLISHKKITNPFSLEDGLLLLLIGFITLSTVFISPNKVQSILNPTNGLALWLSLLILYLYSKAAKIRPLQSMFYGTFISALLFLIIDLTNPFKSIAFSPYWKFLSTVHFSTTGSLLDNAILFGFFSILSISGFVFMIMKKDKSALNWAHIFMTMIILLASIQTVIVLSKTSLQLPPFMVSWLMGLETLKNLGTGFLGFGVDNGLTAFTLSKVPSYNLLPYWNQFFRAPGIGFIHLWVEVGIISLFLFIGLLVSSMIKVVKVVNQKSDADGEKTDASSLFVALCFMILLFCIAPLTQFFWVIMFVALIEVSMLSSEHTRSIDLHEMTPLIGFLSLILLGMTFTAGYFTVRAYASEFYFKKALDNASSASKVYDYHRKALQFNPYNEKVRTSYSQVNLVIANSIAKKKDLSSKDKQTITQAVQASISEAKALIQLNPQKVTGWINLASIYRTLIHVAKGSDVWTVSAYQRAVALDPYNPSLRLNLGGVYYTLGTYDKAEDFFKQAIQLKPNFANAYYNLAWAQHKEKKDDDAVKSMSNVLALMKDKTSADYKKAEKEKAEFETSAKEMKKKTSESTSEKAPATKPNQLTLPQPQPTLNPQIELPKDAGIASDSAR